MVPFCFVLLCIWGQFPSTSPRGLIICRGFEPIRNAEILYISFYNMVNATCVACFAVTPHPLYRVSGKLGLSMRSVSGLFVLGKSYPSRTFLLLEDSNVFWICLSLLLWEAVLLFWIIILKIIWRKSTIVSVLFRLYLWLRRCVGQLCAQWLVVANDLLEYTHQNAFLSSQIYFSIVVFKKKMWLSQVNFIWHMYMK